MVVIITLAGKSQRFMDAGFAQPKWSLPYRRKTILENIVRDFLEMTHKFHDIYVVCLDSQHHYLESSLEESVIRKVHILTIESGTNGQAETAALCIEKAKLSDEPVLIAPGDALIRNLSNYTFDCEFNWMGVTRLEGTRWSFARINERNLIIETAEKKRISDWASVGYYNFRKGNLLIESLNLNPERVNESYIAPLYNHLISRGEVVRPVFIDSSDYVDFGTPDAYSQRRFD